MCVVLLLYLCCTWMSWTSARTQVLCLTLSQWPKALEMATQSLQLSPVRKLLKNTIPSHHQFTPVYVCNTQRTAMLSDMTLCAVCVQSLVDDALYVYIHNSCWEYAVLCRVSYVWTQTREMCPSLPDRCCNSIIYAAYTTCVWCAYININDGTM